jgi:hypothetical protein
MSTELRVADRNCRIRPRDIVVPQPTRIMFNVTGSSREEGILGSIILHLQKKRRWKPFLDEDIEGSDTFNFSAGLDILLQQGNVLVERDGEIQRVNHRLITDKLYLTHRVVARCYAFHPAR